MEQKPVNPDKSAVPLGLAQQFAVVTTQLSLALETVLASFSSYKNRPLFTYLVKIDISLNILRTIIKYRYSSLALSLCSV